jgi:hypothetical protein
LEREAVETLSEIRGNIPEFANCLWRQLIIYMAQIQIAEVHRGSPEKKVGYPMETHPLSY